LIIAFRCKSILSRSSLRFSCFSLVLSPRFYPRSPVLFVYVPFLNFLSRSLYISLRFSIVLLFICILSRSLLRSLRILSILPFSPVLSILLHSVYVLSPFSVSYVLSVSPVSLVLSTFNIRFLVRFNIRFICRFNLLICSFLRYIDLYTLCLRLSAFLRSCRV
jgi:hypothetical protein